LIRTDSGASPITAYAGFMAFAGRRDRLPVAENAVLMRGDVAGISR
jgi:hypothetical protein